MSTTTKTKPKAKTPPSPPPAAATSVVEMRAYTGTGYATQRFYTTWDTADRYGIDHGRAWITKELGRTPHLEEIETHIDGHRAWEDPAAAVGESPRIELSEWHVHDGPDDEE